MNDHTLPTPPRMHRLARELVGWAATAPPGKYMFIEIMPACSLFDPEPIRIEPATEIPLEIAITIRRENVPFEIAAGDVIGRRDLRRDTLSVDGRRAVRLKGEATGTGIEPAGTPRDAKTAAP